MTYLERLELNIQYNYEEHSQVIPHENGAFFIANQKLFFCFLGFDAKGNDKTSGKDVYFIVQLFGTKSPTDGLYLKAI